MFTGDGLGKKEIAPVSTPWTTFHGREPDKERLKARRRVSEGLECRDDPGRHKRLFLSAGNITISIRHSLIAMVVLT